MESWEPIESEQDVYKIIEQSVIRPQVIFKHSTTCGISAQAQYNLIEGIDLIAGQADLHYLDLLNHRAISNLIAKELHVTHQSPQIIVLKNKEVVYTSSHHSINPQKIAEKF